MGNPLFDPADSGAQYLTSVGQTGGSNLIINDQFDNIIGIGWTQTTGGPWSILGGIATTSGSGPTIYKWGWNIGDEPTLSNYLTSEENEIYPINQQFIMADSGVADGNYMAVDLTKLDNQIANIIGIQPSVVVIDVESLSLGTNDSDEDILSAWGTYNVILTGIQNSDFDGLLGVYAYMPQRTWYAPTDYRSNTGNAGYINSYNAWKARNTLAISGGATDNVDIMFPSLYTLYRNTGTYPDVNDDPLMDPKWGYYAEESIAEAQRLGGGKPVVPVLWPQYHQGGTAQGEPDLKKMWIEQDFFQYQLDRCVEFAGGFMVWNNQTPNGITNIWDENWGWVKALRTYIGPAEIPPTPTDKYLFDYRPYDAILEEIEDYQVLLDFGTSGNHGQIGSTTGTDVDDPTWTSIGLQFDGSDDYCVIPTGIMYNGDWSLFGIITSGDGGTIYSEADSVDNNPSIRILSNVSNEVLVNITNAAGSAQASRNSSVPIFDGSPHSFMITFDYSLGVLQLYIDGSGDTTDSSVNGDFSGSDTFNIGRRLPVLGGGQVFDGTLCVLKCIQTLLGTGDAVDLHNEHKSDLALLGVNLVDI